MINSKIKGSSFEREVVRLLTDKLKAGDFARVYGSGTVGTTLGVPTLMGDIHGKIAGFPKSFKGECKVGYSNSHNKESKSLTLKKEWLDKVQEEARNTYSYPVLFGKFDNVRTGIKYFAVLDIDTFAEIVNLVTELNKELILTYEEIEKRDKLEKSKG